MHYFLHLHKYFAHCNTVSKIGARFLWQLLQSSYFEKAVKDCLFRGLTAPARKKKNKDF